MKARRIMALMCNNVRHEAMFAKRGQVNLTP